MSELQTFLEMLERAGIGHGTRDDYNPEGIGVQVECGDEATDWLFDAHGNLIDVCVCD